MLVLHIQKFQDFHFIRFDRSEEFNKSIKPFIIGSESGPCVSILPSNYLKFLKMVKKFFGSNVQVVESQAFDSQEFVSDCMITNQNTSKKLNELIVNDDDTQDGFASSKPSDQDSDSTLSTPPSSPVTPPKKRVKFSERKVKIMTSGNEYKITFFFDPLVVSTLKEIEGKRYDPTERSWYIPLDQKKEFLSKMSNIGRNVLWI